MRLITAESYQELINNYKVNSPIVALDLLDIPNIKAAVREGVNLLGGNLDILVNNAGGVIKVISMSQTRRGKGILQ